MTWLGRLPPYLMHGLPWFCCCCALQPVEQQADPQLLEARHLLARKQLLLDPENGTLKK